MSRCVGVASTKAACERLGYIVAVEASSLYGGYWYMKRYVKPSLSSFSETDGIVS